jgi:ribosomal protein S18 acetylase RimI-like enzyme
MEAVVRPYEPNDRDACRALWVQLTEWHRQLYDDQTLGGADPGRAFDDHLAALGAERIWVAELEGRVLGLAGLVAQGPKAELEPVVVHTGFRGRGLGRKLAEATVAAAREAGFQQVVVRPVGRNTDAIRFFHALGFDVLGRVDLRLDLAAVDRRAGERVAGRTLRV